jgi:predicted bacteriocin transport accessory protein
LNKGAIFIRKSQMKKRSFWCLLVILSLALTLTGCAALFGNSQVSTEEQNAYDQNTQNLTLIEPDALNQIIEQKTGTVFIYFGRVTCPYCRDFVASLHEQKPEQQTIYYIDTEETETDKQIQAIREKYEIETVPGFIKVTADSYDTFNTKKGILSEFFNK